MPPVTARRRDLSRPFALSDAMILVAALAFGLAAMPRDFVEAMGWARGPARGITLGLGPISLGPLTSPPPQKSWILVRLAVQNAATLWLAATLGCATCRLRRPRPPFRRLRDQPGAVACLGVAAVLPFPLAANLLTFLASPHRSPAILATLDGMQHHAPPTVVAGWALLLLGKRWRPEPGWIEALGLILGCGWIALFAFDLVRVALDLD